MPEIQFKRDNKQVTNTNCYQYYVVDIKQIFAVIAVLVYNECHLLP